MHVRNIAIAAILLALSAASAVAAPPVPRASPELTIVDSSGKETPLSSFKGKVVLLEFLLVDCPHCLRVAQTINKLHAEMAERGLETVGVAFDNRIGGLALQNLVRVLKLDYPVGRTTSDKVDSYLGRSVMDRMQVPQVVIVDRTGVIRAQSRAIGEANLTDEGHLRGLVDELLDEQAPEKTEKTN